MIVKTAELYHYDPRLVNDEFSGLVFSEFIELLDPNGVYFTQEDMIRFEEFKDQIDDQILQKECTFLDFVTKIYKRDLELVISLLTSLNDKKIEFNENDSLIRHRPIRYKSRDQLNVHWENIIKLDILNTWIANNDSLNKIAYPTIEMISELKKVAIAQNSCKLQSILQNSKGFDEYVGNKYLKSIARTFDPHTNFLTPSDEQGFEERLSKHTYSFGFIVTENEKGDLEVKNIVPGSSAWKSNKLNEGDIILQIELPTGEIENVDCLSSNKVLQIISDKKTTHATFKIRKQNGETENILLMKAKNEIEENTIQSFLIDGEQKCGYIYIPSFYAEQDSHHQLPNGCANDLAKQLITLELEGITGLIIDVRNNGGGSILEAIRLAGIFIDYGALGIMDYRNEKPYTLKDLDRGTIFNGPMVVLINSFSASASELFAAAMQDHNRAVIVGSKSFGKSTAQEIIPLGANKATEGKNRSVSDDENGILKLTTGMLFRVTGKSHQKHGILPDIVLPDIIEQLPVGEIQFKTALKSSAISKKTYYFPGDTLPISYLRNRSSQRIQNNNSFLAIKEYSHSLADQFETSSVPLGFISFLKFYYNQNKNADLKNKPGGNSSTFDVKLPESSSLYFELNKILEEQNNEACKQIMNDIAIQESYQILLDLIKQFKD